MLHRSLLAPLAFALTVSFAARAADTATPTPTVGQKPVDVTLSGDDGSLVKDGSAWSSDSLKGKVTLLLYVDPDDGDLNNDMTERLKKENFPHETFGSVAVINMAATWKPNAIISSVLKGKQEKYPHTVYVKDYTRKLVKAWGLKDEAYEVILFDKEGRVLFRKDGQMKPADVDQLVTLIKGALG